MVSTAVKIVQALEQEGVRYVFGVPGEENLDILEAIRNSSLEFILVRHEQVAGFMAATIGRLTGVPAVALSTLGPGATNLVTAATYAQLGAMPLIMITGQKPIRRSKQGAFQIVDVVGMMTPITKFSKQIVEGETAPSLVREAVRLAELERPGAVHLELPEDIAEEQIEAELLPRAETRRPVAEQKGITWAIDALLASKKPLLVIGAGANRKRTAKMLNMLVNDFGIPFVVTQMGKGVVDERSDFYAGTAALSSDDYVHDVIDQADLILNIGHDIVEKPPFIMRPQQKVVHVNFEPASVNEIYFPQVEVVGDIANAIWQIIEGLKQCSGDCGWSNDYHKSSISALNERFEQQVASASTVTPQALVSTLRSHLDDEDIVALDNGMYKIWFARHYEARAENTLLLDNALATMGAGVPSAMAAKLVRPDQRVVAVAGDGGFMMNSQALETAVRMKLKLTVLILDDSSYQMIKWKQHASGFESWGLDFSNPDFGMYAESYGAKALSAATPQELAAALAEADSHDGVSVVDVKFDYSTQSEDLKKVS